ncbi:MAG: protein translocase subunit SecF [Nanoarchaeota archaeon]|nr:protein translocase subunit SecF [Nanoarchaeota archaeon]
MDIKGWYAKHYKKLFVIPIIILIACLGIIANHYAKTGDFVGRDVTLKGGVTVTISTDIPVPDMKEYLAGNFPASDVVVRTLTEFGTDVQTGFIIEASDLEEAVLKKAVEERIQKEQKDFALTKDNYSAEQVGSSLGESFYKQMLTAILLAFAFMAIVVLITFRSIVPSFTIVFCAFCDMVFPIAMMNILGIRLSTAGIAALLMLIGYSVDTDILITTKALKRQEEGNVIDRMFDGVKTGLTMTCTSLVAIIAGYFISSSYVIKEIFLILIFGLLYDIVVTYFLNAGILVWWTRRKAGEQ